MQSTDAATRTRVYTLASPSFYMPLHGVHPLTQNNHPSCSCADIRSSFFWRCVRVGSPFFMGIAQKPFRYHAIICSPSCACSLAKGMRKSCSCRCIVQRQKHANRHVNKPSESQAPSQMARTPANLGTQIPSELQPWRHLSETPSDLSPPSAPRSEAVGATFAAVGRWEVRAHHIAPLRVRRGRGFRRRPLLGRHGADARRDW